MIPLNDLGTGLYLNQFQGGLYPGGSNIEPAQHSSDGLARALAIQPLDLSGNPSASGKYVMLSIGMSNTTQEFCSAGSGLPPDPWTFMGQAAANANVNHTQLTIANGAQGGKSASYFDSPTDPDYDRIRDTVLAPQGLSEKQVQVAWVKEADPGPTVSLPNASANAYTLETELGNIVRSMKVRYPNLQQVSSRIYAGYATSNLNPEPYAYESGLSVKWLIQSQINQMSGGTFDPRAGNLDYSNGTAPWIDWGPYMWADGTTPRSDGLTWSINDFDPSDRTHPSQSGETKVGGMLLNYMLNSPYSQPWFVSSGPTWIATNGGNWSNSANWSGGAPNAVGAQARFLGAITAPSIVTLDTPITVGHIFFNNTNSYTLAGSATNTLTLQVASGNADINLASGSHTISAPLNLISNTNILGSGTLFTGGISNNGLLEVSTTLRAGPIDGPGSVSLDSSRNILATHVRQAQLTIGSSARVAIASSGGDNGTSKLGALNIAGSTNAWSARLDLSNNGLVIDYGGTSPLAQIENQLKSGYNGGSWNGNGIMSAAASAQRASAHPTALGVNEASAMNISTFKGVGVDATSVIVRYTYTGDASLDGAVNLSDFSALAANFNGTGKHWAEGDFNYDGKVDLSDFTLLAANFNLTLPAPPQIGATVPEPGIPCSVMTLLSLLRRRRHVRRNCFGHSAGSC